MAPPAKKRRVGGNSNESNGHASDDQGRTYHPPFPPVTLEAKTKWQGFCEIESEPVRENCANKLLHLRNVDGQNRILMTVVSGLLQRHAQGLWS